MPETDTPPNGHLLAHLLRFGRLLRQAGITVSTHQLYELAEGLTCIDLARRDDFRHTARCFLVHHADQLDIFERAFDMFWSGQIELTMELGFSHQRRRTNQVADGLLESDQAILGQETGLDPPAPDEDDEPDAPRQTRVSPTYSPVEMLRHKDFADFTEQEMETARRLIQNLVWRWEQRLTRRKVRAYKRASYLDLRRSVRANMKHSGEILRLAWRRRKSKPRPLVVICDISGSMERYSRLFLHFIYSLARQTRHVEAFVFGTRLTHITPALRQSDVDTAVHKMSELVLDWSGGTRIGESLRTFNYQWSRRVLGRGTLAIIISDGWDRGDMELLEREMGRLRRSVSRLIWLNPLLGAPDYQPLVRGMQTALPYVDDFLPLNNLASLEQFTQQIGSLE
ncbi:MAG: VWA domain-containing protein [Anaerolineae bacterium]